VIPKATDTETYAPPNNEAEKKSLDTSSLVKPNCFAETDTTSKSHISLDPKITANQNLEKKKKGALKSITKIKF
jgi:hypothetical protein